MATGSVAGSTAAEAEAEVRLWARQCYFIDPIDRQESQSALQQDGPLIAAIHTHRALNQVLWLMISLLISLPLQAGEEGVEQK